MNTETYGFVTAALTSPVATLSVASVDMADRAQGVQYDSDSNPRLESTPQMTQLIGVLVGAQSHNLASRRSAKHVISASRRVDMMP